LTLLFAAGQWRASQVKPQGLVETTAVADACNKLSKQPDCCKYSTKCFWDDGYGYRSYRCKSITAAKTVVQKRSDVCKIYMMRLQDTVCKIRKAQDACCYANSEYRQDKCAWVGKMVGSGYCTVSLTVPVKTREVCKVYNTRYKPNYCTIQKSLDSCCAYAAKGCTWVPKGRYNPFGSGGACQALTLAPKTLEQTRMCPHYLLKKKDTLCKTKNKDVQCCFENKRVNKQVCLWRKTYAGFSGACEPAAVAGTRADLEVCPAVLARSAADECSVLKGPDACCTHNYVSKKAYENRCIWKAGRLSGGDCLTVSKARNEAEKRTCYVYYMKKKSPCQKMTNDAAKCCFYKNAQQQSLCMWRGNFGSSATGRGACDSVLAFTDSTTRAKELAVCPAYLKAKAVNACTQHASIKDCCTENFKDRKWECQWSANTIRSGGKCLQMNLLKTQPLIAAAKKVCLDWRIESNDKVCQPQKKELDCCKRQECAWYKAGWMPGKSCHPLALAPTPSDKTFCETSRVKANDVVCKPIKQQKDCCFHNQNKAQPECVYKCNVPTTGGGYCLSGSCERASINLPPAQALCTTYLKAYKIDKCTVHKKDVARCCQMNVGQTTPVCGFETGMMGGSCKPFASLKKAADQKYCLDYNLIKADTTCKKLVKVDQCCFHNTQVTDIKQHCVWKTAMIGGSCEPLAAGSVKEQQYCPAYLKKTATNECSVVKDKGPCCQKNLGKSKPVCAFVGGSGMSLTGGKCKSVGQAGMTKEDLKALKACEIINVLSADVVCKPNLSEEICCDHNKKASLSNSTSNQQCFWDKKSMFGKSTCMPSSLGTAADLQTCTAKNDKLLCSKLQERGACCQEPSCDWIKSRIGNWLNGKCEAKASASKSRGGYCEALQNDPCMKFNDEAQCCTSKAKCMTTKKNLVTKKLTCISITNAKKEDQTGLLTCVSFRCAQANLNTECCKLEGCDWVKSSLGNLKKGSCKAEDTKQKRGGFCEALKKDSCVQHRTKEECCQDNTAHGNVTSGCMFTKHNMVTGIVDCSSVSLAATNDKNRGSCNKNRCGKIKLKEECCENPECDFSDRLLDKITPCKSKAAGAADGKVCAALKNDPCMKFTNAAQCCQHQGAVAETKSAYSSATTSAYSSATGPGGADTAAAGAGQAKASPTMAHTAAARSTTPSASQSCTDRRGDCAKYKEYCPKTSKNAAWAQHNCCQTCQAIATCKIDLYSDCNAPKVKAYAPTHQAWAKENCCATYKEAAATGVCKDLRSDCATSPAVKRYETTHPAWFKQNCCATSERAAATKLLATPRNGISEDPLPRSVVLAQNDFQCMYTKNGFGRFSKCFAASKATVNKAEKYADVCLKDYCSSIKEKAECCKNPACDFFEGHIAGIGAKCVAKKASAAESGLCVRMAADGCMQHTTGKACCGCKSDACSFKPDFTQRLSRDPKGTCRKAQNDKEKATCAKYPAVSDDFCKTRSNLVYDPGNKPDIEGGAFVTDRRYIISRFKLTNQTAATPVKRKTATPVKSKTATPVKSKTATPAKSKTQRQ